jgi:hypothetical protein
VRAERLDFADGLSHGGEHLGAAGFDRHRGR